MWYMMKGSALLYWSKWKFCWIVDKAKVNGTEEFEDYEPSLTKEQRAERDKVLAHFEEAFRQIQTE